MNEYEYGGYIITETPEGYFVIGAFEFPSYEEATDWVDQMNEPEPIHTYQIFYVTDDGYSDREIISAPSRADALNKLLAMYSDIDYVTDIIQLDE